MCVLENPHFNIANLEMVETLLTKGCNVNSVNKEGVSALTCAVINNEPKIVKLLLENNANTEIKGIGIEYGKTPLLYACLMGYIDIVKLLIEIGKCDIYAKAPNDAKTALMLCAVSDNSVLVSYLIEIHSKNYNKLNMHQFVNETNINGVTSLMIAANNGNYTMCNMLVSKFKADPTIKDVVK